MISTKLAPTSIKKIFKQLHQNFGGVLSVDLKEHVLNFNNDFGQGRIRGIEFKGGISYLELDMTCSENYKLSISNSDYAPVCFAYCSRGKVKHQFNSETKSEKNTVENFQTAILTCAPNTDNILTFSKDVRTKTSLIVVNTASKTAIPKPKSLNFRLQELFMKNGKAENSIFISSYNLKIADKIQDIEVIRQQGVVRSLLLEGLVHMILGLEIQQHAEDTSNKNKGLGSLTSRELDSVSEISKFVNNYPETQLCIAQLSRKSGLSPNKLQEGFKLMHGTTVTDYIRDVRIQKAEHLIKTTDLNISEVVYSIGFTSRSYFSKIFKKKYNCSPKQYKDRQKTVSEAV